MGTPARGLLLRLAGRLIYSAPIIRIYEWHLRRQLNSGPMPRHIAVVLDGNRRWASSMGLSNVEGHRAGAERVKDLLRWCRSMGIRIVTVYAFSTENLRRPREEVEAIMRIFRENVQEALTEETVYRNGVRVKVIGRLDLLPPEILESARRIEEATVGYNKLFLNVAFGYGGRAEIVDAVRSIAEDVAAGIISSHEISEKEVESRLYTAHLPFPDPDMIIRTSGEERLSNFLLWQSAYSELIFLDVFWPEFRRIDLMRAIRTFQRRKRRFGA